MTPHVAQHPRRPFDRLPFSSLPQHPIRAHPYYSSIGHQLEMDSAALGPLRIHYRTYGSGPPLLLIHGVMTTSYSWRYVLDELGEHYTLVIPDLPGAGRSSAPTGRLSAGAVAAWIGEFQTTLELRGCPVVGNSLGGYLVMRHTLTDPSAFAAVVNIHSPAVPLPRLRLLHVALSLPGASALIRWWIQRDTTRWAHRAVHYYDETLKSLEEAHEYGDPLATRDGATAFIGYLRDVMHPSGFAEFRETLTRRHSGGQQFPVPLLLIYARQDPLVPPRVGDQLAALVPTAALQRLDRSSHFAHVDTPDAVSEAVIDFLDNRSRHR
jgi:pimeloyl-ACP methyl ester carboxylesterase